MAIKYKGKLLRKKKLEGKILKDEIDGELLKDKVLEGNPLWKDKKELNEEKYKKENLNE
jgi:hypothetical protein